MTLRQFMTTVDETDEELVAQIRALMDHARREAGETVLTVHGYDDDPRELWQIPEARSHLARMVEFGAIAILTRSTWCRELGAPAWTMNRPLMGAFEVWMASLGYIRGDKIELPMDEAKELLRRFRKDVLSAADRALSRNLHRYAHVPAAGPERMLTFSRRS
jgi:hypothetical protein